MLTPHTRTESVMVTGPFSFVAEARHADVHVIATPGLEHARATVTTTGSRAVEMLDACEITVSENRLTVRVPSIVRFLVFGASVRVDAEVPEGADLTLTSGSGDVTCEGTLGVVHARSGSGDVRAGAVRETTLATGSGDVSLVASSDAKLTTGSGDISVGDVGDLHARVGSGDVTVRTLRGNGSVKSGSGRLRVVELSGSAQLKSGSGAIQVGTLTGEVAASAASGAISLERVLSGVADLTTASGSQRIGVAHGTAVLVDAESRSGRVRSDLEELGAPAKHELTARVRARAVSGSISFHRVMD